MEPRSNPPGAGHATFDHGADIGVSGWGATPAAAFEQAALALTSVVCDPDAIEPSRTVEIACQEDDPELLLYAWLAALVFEMATQRLLFARFEVAIDSGRLTARAHGEPVDVRRHRPAIEVKGPTLTELSLRRAGDGLWHARCVVDV